MDSAVWVLAFARTTVEYVRRLRRSHDCGEIASLRQKIPCRRSSAAPWWINPDWSI